MDISIIIRTYNEERFLGELLSAIRAQHTHGMKLETIVVDSGSTDRTLDIAQAHGCKIVHISKDVFTFGRSLNLGCEEAVGRYLVFISGHCIPVDRSWLINLISPLKQGATGYCYGRQIGNGQGRFSESQIFAKYFPEVAPTFQEGFFCNNANSAMLKNLWQECKFDEELTGLEDMALAKRLVNKGMQIAYVPESPVYHLHNESWRSIRNRYEREALALQHIMPQVQISLLDFLRYFVSAVFLDAGAALKNRCLPRKFPEIVMFRLMQFWGGYRGNNEHRKLSNAMKERYFFPK